MFHQIYLLRHLVNGKVYVGQTSNEIKRYTVECFSIEVLTIAHSLEIANYWVRYFVEKYHADDPAHGYNFKRSLNPLDS
jgi:hypothetical protein